MNHRSWKITGLIAMMVIVLSIPLSLLMNLGAGNMPGPVAVFTGGQACAECHQKEYRLWKGSDHDKSMAVATDSTVLGNFNNAEFHYNGKTSKFYKRDLKFFVYTEGPAGTMKEFEVSHTFGIRPLQQYLIPFGNGKYQCLPIAWNSLKKEWFQMASMVYKPEDLKPDNWLYWTNQAPCHTRRSSLGPYDYSHGEFLGNAIPQLPVPPFYHIDGQFLEEDYEFGSFTQSKMYMKDVRCGDCHDPHSLQRKFEGNALCTQCHRADEYDNYNHHLHKYKGEDGKAFYNKHGEKIEVGAGALCRDCHMPGNYFMGIDRRYDHSMRIPRPDLSLELGTPNACTHCHDDKTDQWALEYVNKWYGERKKSHYATLLADGFEGRPGADSGLLRIINSNLYPEIIRATAIGYLSSYQGNVAQEALRKALNDPDPLLRYTAVENYQAGDSAGLFGILPPLLNDPVKAVRMEAANRLAIFPENSFNEIQHALFTKALDEYRRSQEYVADFPMGRHNLGNYYSKMNDMAKAEENYREAIVIDNLFYPAKSNLALIYYQQGKTDSAASLFSDLIANHPDLTDGYYYLALLYGEQKKYNEAIALLETASSKTGSNPRIYYNLGLLYQQVGQNDKCEAALLKGLGLDPCNFDLLYALFVFHVNQQNRDKAAIYINRLKGCFPNEKTVVDLYNDFTSRGAIQ